MSEATLWLSHRELVSAIVSLVLGGDGVVQPFFRDLGYTLNALEIPMVDSYGRDFTPDIHLLKERANLSLLVECKCSSDNLDRQQLEKYLATAGDEVVRGGRLSTLPDPRVHRVDALFVALQAAVTSVSSLIGQITSAGPVAASGFGVARVAHQLIDLPHDELSDADLSLSLRSTWAVDIERLPLERLPYEPSSPDWELADSITRTLVQFFVQGTQRFDVEDVCRESNELWSYLGDQQTHIRDRRVRPMIRNMRRTAFKDRLRAVPGTTAREERWEFKGRTSSRADAVQALQRRARHYVDLLRQGKGPRPEDFADIDQLPLPVHLDIGEDE